jgi:hypothetical protein
MKHLQNGSKMNGLRSIGNFADRFQWKIQANDEKAQWPEGMSDS